MNVFLNFVIKILFSNDYNIILIINNELTKKKHYILFNKKKNSIITITIAYLLLNYI